MFMLPSHGQLYPSSTIRVLDAVAVVAIFFLASRVALNLNSFYTNKGNTVTEIVMIQPRKKSMNVVSRIL